jgi:D-alanine-D-alanine ligase-like ATP-grasp enzyme
MHQVNTVNTVRLQTRALIAEGVKRGFSCDVLHGFPIELVRASKDGAGFYFQQSPGQLTTQRRADFLSLNDRVYQKELLTRFKLPIVPTRQVVRHPSNVDVPSLRWPVVCKPRTGTISHAIPKCRHIGEVAEAVDHIVKHSPVRECLIEEDPPGQTYQILVIWQKYASCVERRPAAVTGDGQHTIVELINLRNQERGRGHGEDLDTAQHDIVYDDEAIKMVTALGLTNKSVLAAGQTVPLREAFTAGAGADTVDVTDDLHADTIALCEEAAKGLDLPLVAFEIVTPDIRQSCRVVGAFRELRTNGVDTRLNEFANIGTPRPISSLLWDAVIARNFVTPAFPEV